MRKKIFSRNKGKEDAEERGDKSVKGCRMILCEDPVTGDIRLFPVSCPKGYVEKIRATMREKGVRFSGKSLPDDVSLITPEE